MEPINVPRPALSRRYVIEYDAYDNWACGYIEEAMLGSQRGMLCAT